MGIISRLLSTARQQSDAVLLIELEVVVKATSRFFDVSSSLIEGQREAIEGNDQVGRLIVLLLACLQTLSTMQQELGAFHQPHLFHFDGVGKPANSRSAC